MNYPKYIEIKTNKRFGCSCIKCAGSPCMMFQAIASGLTRAEIIHDFPELSEDQIIACLAFAAVKEQKIRVAS